MHQLLIVDDQIDLADDLAHMLPWHEVGIAKVYKAYSAQEALEIVQAQPIDIVITDIRMPGMTGLELIERIRSSWKNIKCILLSGYSDFEYAQTALQHQANNYLLKPADDEQLLEAVRKAAREIEEQWGNISSKEKALASLKAHLPVLRNHLLQDLLNNRKYTEEAISEQLALLEIPFKVGMSVLMLFLRMEGQFYQYDSSDTALMEFAVTNMANEIFADDFHLWSTKDPHDYLVFLIQPKEGKELGKHISTDEIERKISQLQHYVKLYLKGTISAFLHQEGRFPVDLGVMYDTALHHFLQRIGGDRELLITYSGDENRGKANSIRQLYEPPLLTHLLEAGQWEMAAAKLNSIFDELEQHWGESHEHILETYFTIISMFSHSVHKNKRWLVDIMEDKFDHLVNGIHFHTVQQLREWTFHILRRYEEEMASKQINTRKDLVKQVQEYVSSHLEQASLQTIASHVYLNPSYLSKVYKMETGEGISEFIFRLKMERAEYLLQSTNDKIYEIAQRLGYQKTSYFIKVFKDKYGLTPQEYRDKTSSD